MNKNSALIIHKPYFKYLYGVTVFFLILTGFGQMPIFKRYYIADIPGLGWLAEFFITHYMHYLFAVIFIFITAYFLTEYILRIQKAVKITISGYLRIAIITGLIATGTLLVIRNFSGYRFPPGFIIIMDLSHFGLVMAFLFSGFICFVLKKKWLKNRLK